MSQPATQTALTCPSPAVRETRQFQEPLTQQLSVPWFPRAPHGGRGASLPRPRAWRSALHVERPHTRWERQRDPQEGQKKGHMEERLEQKYLGKKTHQNVWKICLLGRCEVLVRHSLTSLCDIPPTANSASHRCASGITGRIQVCRGNCAQNPDNQFSLHNGRAACSVGVGTETGSWGRRGFPHTQAGGAGRGITAGPASRVGRSVIGVTTARDTAEGHGAASSEFSSCNNTEMKIPPLTTFS